VSFDYYDDKLAAQKLRAVYEIAPRRVQQYLNAEVEHVLDQMKPANIVLELGCGYGRILERLSPASGELYGIDTSLSSLRMAGDFLSGHASVYLACMNAANLAFRDHCFDAVVCIQNGISAFHVDQQKLIDEAVRVTRKGGLALFSSYSSKFWDDRLHWFELQARHGLLGEIDYRLTGDGVIVGKDGFTATTVDQEGFRTLTRDLDADVSIVEIDGSSTFCEIRP